MGQNNYGDSEPKSAQNDRAIWNVALANCAFWFGLIAWVGMFALVPGARAQTMTVARGDVTVAVEPYAENVVRVSISLLKERATAAPGYGVSAKPMAGGWTRGAAGDETLVGANERTVRRREGSTRRRGRRRTLRSSLAGRRRGWGSRSGMRMGHRWCRCAGGR